VEPPPASTLVSDDFNACELDWGLWRLVDPRGDGTVVVNGTQVLLSVPGGVSHDVWSDGNNALRLMQVANDTDFEVEVKFESGVSPAYQLQGILVEQDAGNFLRFDFHGDGVATRVLAVKFVGGTPTIVANAEVAAANTSPLYLRVKRTGNEWLQSYSLDGQTWVSVASFSQAIQVGQVGVFAGNAGNVPAHTAVVDYFFNTASPIVPEDGKALAHTLTVTTVGGGSVTRSSENATYSCGEVVELTAVANAGYEFVGWSGAISGVDNPATVTMSADQTVTATFEAEATPLPVISGVMATADETTARVSWTTDKPTTGSVAYGLTPAYELGSVAGASLVTQDTVNLVGLAPGTTYHYQITVRDAGGVEARTADATFTTTTPVESPPVISEVVVTADDASAIITWTTDKPTTGSVAYGPNKNLKGGTVHSSTLATQHSVTIAGLNPNSTYHYQITATDASGNFSQTSVATFTTVRRIKR
jgi:uncharacterized repeat protein (TIGR02543 family)